MIIIDPIKEGSKYIGYLCEKIDLDGPNITITENNQFIPNDIIKKIFSYLKELSPANLSLSKKMLSLLWGGATEDPIPCFNGYVQKKAKLILELSLPDNEPLIQTALRIGSKKDVDCMFTTALNCGNTDGVRELLKDERVDPSANNYKTIISAVQHGRHSVVKLLLENVNPSANNNYTAIIEALMHRDFKTVKLLLNGERVNPSAHIDVVELLEDERVDL